MRILLVLFIVVPMAEMLLLIKVGGLIGALPTIALVCLTAMIGVALIKAQGLSLMQSAQRKLASGEVPAKEMLDGLSLVVGGAMLLTPGFVTDSIGFLLLVPVIRHALFHRLLAKILAGEGVMHACRTRPMGRASSDSSAQVIQGEYTRDDENHKR